MLYALPGSADAKINTSPSTTTSSAASGSPWSRARISTSSPRSPARPYTQAARSTAEDVELALDAAHAIADKWAAPLRAERANLCLKIADRLEANLEKAGLRRDRR